MGLRMKATDLDVAVSTGAQDRVCVVCGNSLARRRKDARCCSASCRAEASRFKAILSGTYSGRYRSIAERLANRKNSRPLPFPQRKTEKAPEAHTDALRGLC